VKLWNEDENVEDCESVDGLIGGRHIADSKVWESKTCDEKRGREGKSPFVCMPLNRKVNMSLVDVGAVGLGDVSINPTSSWQPCWCGIQEVFARLEAERYHLPSSSIARMFCNVKYLWLDLDSH